MIYLNTLKTLWHILIADCPDDIFGHGPLVSPEISDIFRRFFIYFQSFLQIRVPVGDKIAICVIGSEEKIKNNCDLFEHIENLIGTV